jgi:hypothetical protein
MASCFCGGSEPHSFCSYRVAHFLGCGPDLVTADLPRLKFQRSKFFQEILAMPILEVNMEISFRHHFERNA